MNQNNRGGRPASFTDNIYGSNTTSNPTNGLDGSQSTALTLYTMLRAPCLSMLQIYLFAFGGKQSLRTCMQDFRNEHHYVVRAMYLVDQLFDFALLGIVVFVFLRGLGVVH